MHHGSLTAPGECQPLPRLRPQDKEEKLMALTSSNVIGKRGT